MRIAELRLLAYGPFEGKLLRFGPAGGLDVVFGHNEAGKSTALRAVLGLLFGVEERTTDAHTITPERLRIGALLQDETGEALEVVRRKGRKNTLLTPSDQPLDPAPLERMLGGVTRAMYETTFGLDDERLRRGAEALLEGKGDLGESLYAAATGATELHALLVEKRREAEELFSPRAHTRPLNQAIKALAEAKKRVIALGTAVETYNTQVEGVRRARAEREELTRERAALDRERDRLARWRAARERLETVGEQRARLDARRVALRDAVEAIVVSEAMLAHEPQLAALAEQLGSHRKAQADLPKLEGEIVGLEGEVSAALVRVRKDMTLEEAERLRMARGAEVRTRKLAQQGAVLEEKLAGAREAEQAAERELGSAERALATAPDAPAVGPLSRLLRAQRGSDVAARVTGAREKTAGLRARARALAESLGLGADPVAAARRPVPAAEAVQEANARDEEARRADGDARKRAQDLEMALVEVDRGLAELRAEGDVPRQEELTAARDARDAILGRVRSGAKDFDALADAIARADSVADRLRHDAARAMRLVQLEEGGKEARAKLAVLGAGREAAAREAAERAAAWAVLWRPAGVEPGPPEAMRGWLQKHASLVIAVAELEAAGREETEAARARDEALERFAAALSSSPASLEEAFVAAEDAIEAAREAQQERRAAQKEQDRVTADLATKRQAREVAEAAVHTWRASWAEATAGLGLGPDALPEEVAAVVDELGRLFQEVDALEKLRRRVESIGRDADRFEKDVARLVGACAPGLAGKAAIVAAEELNALHKKWVADQAERRAKQDELKELESQLAVQREAEEAASRELRSLAGELGDGAPEDAAHAAARLERIDERLRELEDELQRKNHEIGANEQGLPQLAGESLALGAAMQAQQELARIRDLAERAACARLAAAVLAREIEGYRKRNQGPLLERAGELFAAVTLGGFGSLAVGFGEDDEPVLRAVRADGRELGVPALSDGTRDQLYLALRIASLERLAVSRAPLPVVLDDVFIRFDDPRTRAGLRALATLASRTQVLVFTHQARVVELAREAVDGVHVTALE